jgi:hypothetical protein
MIMSGTVDQEDLDPVSDLVEQAVSFILGNGYPTGCTDNLKRSIRRKAATLTVRGGEVFVTRWKKIKHVGEKVCGAGMH